MATHLAVGSNSDDHGTSLPNDDEGDVALLLLDTRTDEPSGTSVCKDCLHDSLVGNAISKFHALSESVVA